MVPEQEMLLFCLHLVTGYRIKTPCMRDKASRQSKIKNKNIPAKLAPPIASAMIENAELSVPGFNLPRHGGRGFSVSCLQPCPACMAYVRPPPGREMKADRWVDPTVLPGLWKHRSLTMQPYLNLDGMNYTDNS